VAKASLRDSWARLPQWSGLKRCGTQLGFESLMLALKTHDEKGFGKFGKGESQAPVILGTT